MKQPIKIAYCIPGLYAASGMERVLTLKINYLADVLGYDVYVILTEEKELPPYYPYQKKPTSSIWTSISTACTQLLSICGSDCGNTANCKESIRNG